MDVDLTLAAEALGVSAPPILPPPVNWRRLGPVYDTRRRVIRLPDGDWKLQLPRHLMDNVLDRAERHTGLRLYGDDLDRFALAHELVHHWQREQHPDWVEWQQWVYGNFAEAKFQEYMTGVKAKHEDIPHEAEADRRAAEIYQLIKINGD